MNVYISKIIHIVTMRGVEQLQIELQEAVKKKTILEKELTSLRFCIGVLKKEIDYRI